MTLAAMRHESSVLSLLLLPLEAVVVGVCTSATSADIVTVYTRPHEKHEVGPTDVLVLAANRNTEPLVQICTSKADACST